MKRTCTRVLRSALSMLLVFCLAFSLCGAAFANETETKSYVSLGASNVNGYGLRGYVQGDMDDAALDHTIKDGANVLGYMSETPGSYPVLVADELDMDLNQLAISSMRAEELRILLDNEYMGDSYSEWRFTAGQNWFNIALPGGLNALRADVQQKVADAELVTVDIGVNNFGVYVSYQMTSDYSLDSDLALIDPSLAEEFEAGKDYVKGLIAQYAPEYASVLVGMDDFVNTLAYALVGFCVNFDAIIEKIYELNPDVTVVAVSIQNLMDGLYVSVPGVDEPLPLGDLFGALVNAANIYIAAGSPYADEYLCADVRQNGRVEFFLDDLLAYDGDPTTLSQNIIDCFDVYDGTPGTPYTKGLHVEFMVKNYIEGLGMGLDYTDFLNTAYDVVASILQGAAEKNVVDLSALDAMGDVEDALLSAIQNELLTAVHAFYADNTYDYELPETFFEDVATAAQAPVSAVETVAALAVRTSLGNSFFGHPSPVGHQTIANAVVSTYENGITGEDIIKHEVKVALDDLYTFLEKYGPEFVEEAYNYAEANGYIAAVNEALEALKGQIEDYIEAEVLPGLEAQAEALKAQLEALYAELEARKNALEGDLLAQLEALKAELEAKKAELENASEELKAEIEAAITEIEAAIEAIEAAIAEAQAIIAEIEAAIAEAEAALEAICAKIAEVKALVEQMVEEIIIAQEAIEALLTEGCENLDEAVEAVKAVIGTVVELADALNIALDEVAGMIAAVAEDVEAIAARIEAMLGDYAACIAAITEELSAGLEAAAAVLAAIADGIGNIPEDVQAAIDELNAQLAEAVDAIEAAADEAIAAARAEAEALIAELEAELAAKLAEVENAVSAELVAKKAELEAQIAELEAELAAKYAELENAAEELKAEIEAAIAEIEAQIAEAEAALEAVIAEIEATVAEIEAAIAELEAKIAAAKAELEETIAEILYQAEAEIEAKIAETEAAIEALLDEAGALIDEAVAAAAAALTEALEELQAEALLNEVIEEATAAAEAIAQEAIAQATAALEVLTEKALEVQAAVEEMVNEFIAAVEEAYENATTGEYNITETNYYVSLGDQSATSASFADKLAAALNLGDDQWENLAEESLSAADVVELIKAGDMTYISELAKADLVTVSFNPTTYATEQIEAILNNKDTAEIDWSKYVTEEGVPYVEEVIAELEAYLVEQGVPGNLMGLNLVDVASDVAEAYAYSVVEFLANYIVMVEAIHEISPEAEVIIIGAYNSFDGMVITIDGTEVELPMGELMDSLAELTNAHYLTYSMLADNTTFVTVPNTETVLDEAAHDVGNMLGLVNMLQNIGDSVIPTDDGHEYIKDRILGAETIIEDVEGMLGDANTDRVVDSWDASLILQYDAVLLGADGLDLSVCDVSGDGVVDSWDASLILQYDALLITEFPAAA